MDIQDTYRTITKPSTETLFKDKNSKFFGYAFPVKSEKEVKEYIEHIKKQHHSARHWCYAYQIGTDNISYRVNDDGEPNNSAGMPIYGQIQSFNLTNVLIIVVRYFGGVKLGVGGLISAYKTSAQLSLEASKIVERTINMHYLIIFDYKNMNKVMRIIKEKNLNVTNQKLELHCELSISVRKKEVETVLNSFNALFEVQIKAL